MTWPAWLNGPESFGLGVGVGIVVAEFVALWLIDRSRLDRALFDELHGSPNVRRRTLTIKLTRVRL